MILVTLRYRTGKNANIGDLSSLLYDFGLLYDYLVVTSIEDYIPYSFTPNFWYRYGRPLFEEDRAQVYKVASDSPLTIVLAIASWIAVKILPELVRTSGEIADWPANRRKSKAEASIVELSELEKIADIEYKEVRNRQARFILEQTEYETKRARMELEEYREQRERRQNNTLNRIKRRLERNTYQLEDIDVQKEEDTNNSNDEN